MKLIKQVLVFVTVLTAFCPFAVNATTDGANHSVVLRKENKKHNKDYDEEGCRMPSCPVIACINEIDGCIVAGVNNNDILTYEAYDENGESIGVFYDNMQFASFVLSQDGQIEIRLELEEYILVGFITI